MKFARGTNPRQPKIFGMDNINYTGPERASGTGADSDLASVRSDFAAPEPETNNNASVRHMVSMRTVGGVHPIEGADRIERVTVGGWNVVAAKGKHAPGEKVLYFEIDSFLPEDDERFASFAERGRKTVTDPDDNEVSGHVLKTARLRGVYSQGLVMSPSEFGELPDDPSQEDIDALMDDLGVFKYEKPLPASDSGTIKGQFPRSAQKTDAERVQNLTDEFLSSLNPDDWYATEKIDGTSATFVMEGGELKVCSRNYQVDDDGSNIYSTMARELGLAEIMEDGQVIQGEIYGEGVQGNTLGLAGRRLAVFHTEGDLSDDARDLVGSLSVPKIDMRLPATVEEAVDQADGFKSTIAPGKNAEGIVWWCTQ